MTIKVFIVDDSAVVRTHLSDTLQAAGMTVCGSAADPLFAWPKMQAAWPDVLVLDIEMPRMDGLTFLRQVMSERPLPVVMCSTLTERGCETTMQALSAGAVGFVTKPKIGLKSFLEEDGNGLVDIVRTAARANVRALAPAVAAHAARPLPSRAAMPVPKAPPRPGGAAAAERVVAIGISTGGVQSLEVVLRQMRHDAPGTVVVQHMPEKFTASLAARLDTVCAIDVAEAKHGDHLRAGLVLIAPGGRHMRLQRRGGHYVVEIADGPYINHHRPSVDVLFRSVAACAGAHALGVLMTGMGDDGARGLRDMRQAGARTAAQDEASCVVFGMPNAAIGLGAVDDVVPLADIAAWIDCMADAPIIA